jgi:hypothetical protein
MSLPWGAKPVLFELRSHWLTLNAVVSAYCAVDGANVPGATASRRGDRRGTLSGSLAQRGEPSTTHTLCCFRIPPVVRDRRAASPRAGPSSTRRAGTSAPDPERGSWSPSPERKPSYR